MFKHRYFKYLTLIVITFLLASCTASISPRTSQPNIILILTDDQAFHSIQYMPAVQRELVQKGINFTSAYVTTSLCCPSRASIYTGLYVRHHGVLTNRYPKGGALLFKDQNTLPVWLHQAGYRTGLIGKYLNEYNSLKKGYIPPGWDDWHAFYTSSAGNYYYTSYTMNENGSIQSYSTSEADFSTDVVSNKAVSFIKANSDKPFFLSVNFVAPHQPYYAARRHADLFKKYDANFQPYLPPNYFEQDISDKPQWVQTITRSASAVNPAHAEKIYQRQLRALMGVDDAVQAIVNTLTEQGIRGNTMIIFTSDNGYSLGNHGILGKACPYDECLRIPFVVSYPDKIPTARTDNHFILNVDIAPTAAELAGYKNTPPCDGKSFVPLLSNTAANWRTGFFFEQFEDDQDDGGATAIIPAFTGFQTKTWSYVQYINGDKELYDLTNDPYEMKNVAGKPEYNSIMQGLAQQINAITP